MLTKCSFVALSMVACLYVDAHQYTPDVITVERRDIGEVLNHEQRQSIHRNLYCPQSNCTGRKCESPRDSKKLIHVYLFRRDLNLIQLFYKCSESKKTYVVNLPQSDAASDIISTVFSKPRSIEKDKEEILGKSIAFSRESYIDWLAGMHGSTQQKVTGALTYSEHFVTHQASGEDRSLLTFTSIDRENLKAFFYFDGRDEVQVADVNKFSEPYLKEILRVYKLGKSKGLKIPIRLNTFGFQDGEFDIFSEDIHLWHDENGEEMRVDHYGRRSEFQKLTLFDEDTWISAFPKQIKIGFGNGHHHGYFVVNNRLEQTFSLEAKSYDLIGEPFNNGYYIHAALLNIPKQTPFNQQINKHKIIIYQGINDHVRSHNQDLETIYTSNIPGSSKDVILAHYKDNPNSFDMSLRTLFLKLDLLKYYSKDELSKTTIAQSNLKNKKDSFTWTLQTIFYMNEKIEKKTIKRYDKLRDHVYKRIEHLYEVRNREIDFNWAPMLVPEKIEGATTIVFEMRNDHQPWITPTDHRAITSAYVIEQGYR